MENGNIYAFVSDSPGTVRSVVDGSTQPVNSYTYEAYGKRRSKTEGVDNPYLFTGRRLDGGTGEYYYRRRFYNASSGQFLALDPFAPNELSFSYASSNPLTFIDPTGLAIVIAGDPKYVNDMKCSLSKIAKPMKLSFTKNDKGITKVGVAGGTSALFQRCNGWFGCECVKRLLIETRIVSVEAYKWDCREQPDSGIGTADKMGGGFTGKNNLGQNYISIAMEKEYRRPLEVTIVHELCGHIWADLYGRARGHHERFAIMLENMYRLQTKMDLRKDGFPIGDEKRRKLEAVLNDDI